MLVNNAGVMMRPAFATAASAASRAAYDPLAAYARSKTANLLFTAGRHLPPDFMARMGWLRPDGPLLPSIVVFSAAKSVASFVVTAFDPSLAAADDSILPWARDDAAADALWALSQELTGEAFP